MADITVPVPDERTAEFYQFFGLWLAGSLSPTPISAETSKGLIEAPESQSYTSWDDDKDQEKLLADAEALWKKYSPRARGMFGLLIDNPDTEYTGAQIAEAVGIPNGAHGVAGVLAWPGRHGSAIGRGLPTRFREDPETFETFYWIPANRAEVFKTARSMVEGTN